jgi:hypothetical protein
MEGTARDAAPSADFDPELLGVLVSCGFLGAHCYAPCCVALRKEKQSAAFAPLQRTTTPPQLLKLIDSDIDEPRTFTPPPAQPATEPPPLRKKRDSFSASLFAEPRGTRMKLYKNELN